MNVEVVEQNLRIVTRWVLERGGIVAFENHDTICARGDFNSLGPQGRFWWSLVPLPISWKVRLRRNYDKDIVDISLSCCDEVSDITPLIGLKILEQLDLYRTQVTDLSPLSDLKTLKILAFSMTQISDLEPLSGLENLEDLSMNGSHVSNLGPLANLRNLKSSFHWASR